MYIFLYNLISFYVKSLWTGCFIPCGPVIPTRVNCFLFRCLVLLWLSWNLIKIFTAAFGSVSAFITSFLFTFCVQIKCKLVFSRRVMSLLIVNYVTSSTLFFLLKKLPCFYFVFSRCYPSVPFKSFEFFISLHFILFLFTINHIKEKKKIITQYNRNL